MKNVFLKISILCASIFATLAVVFGVRAQYEQQKHVKTVGDVQDYLDQLLQSDITKAQREFAKDRDILLQKAAHMPSGQVTQQTTVTTVVPKKVVTPTVVVQEEKPKSSKKTKSS